MTTQKRDLHTGTSLWSAKRSPPVAHTKLTRDLSTEVLIVGAGISGAFMAESLSESHRVVVIDRRGIAKGSTAASTALIASEVDVPLTLLAGKIGKTNAVRAWRRAALAVQAIKSRSDFLGLADASQLVCRESLYLAGEILSPDQLEDEGRERRAAGLPAIFFSRHELAERFGVRRSAGLLSFGNLAADPIRLAHGYLRVAVQRGAKIFAPTEASGIEATRAGVVVATTQGPTIAADQVIFCTGYELPDFLGPGRTQIASTYAFATRRQSRRLWPTRCLIWEASDPYLYVRDTPDGRVLCGGEDEGVSDAAARDALLAIKIRTLSHKLSRLLPALDPAPEFAWAGTFGETKTGLPIIGEVPHRKGCWAVLGFGGNGTTYSRIAADLVRTALAGKRDPDADLFRF